MSSTTLEIIRGLAQAASNVYDGAHDKRFSYDGEERSVGLKREEGCALMDKRVMDGFKVRFYGDSMILSYHGEVMLKEVYGKNFEQDVESMLNDIKKFLQKEYRKVTDIYSGSSQEPHAQFMIGYIFANVLNDFESAKIEYDNFINQFPQHELVPSVKFELEYLGKNINEIPALKHITS